MPSNHWWPEVRCDKTVAPATTNVLILAQPKCVYLPTDFSAFPLFSIPEPVPSANFLAPHLIP